MAAVSIRRHRPGDGPALAEVLFRSVREAALADYSVEQTEAWMPRPPDPAWFDQRAGDGRTVLVAEDVDGKVVGYTDLEADGHIDHAYCVPEVVGTGVASMLYRALEADARTRGLTRLHVEASEAARRLYSAKGFTVVRRNDLERAGVAIHNFDMVKDLTVDDPAPEAAP